MGQFEWESSNLHVSYPFKQPGIPGLNDAFADAAVVDTEQAQTVKMLALTVTSWSSGDISGTFVYEDGSPFFSGTPLVSVYTYGAWAVVNFTYEDKQVELIMALGYALPLVISGVFPFVARVQECDPKVINSVEVQDGETHAVHVLSGDLLLQAGYNMQTQQLSKLYGPRAGAVAVSLAAIPGAGFGVYPSQCTPEMVLRSFNSIGPDDHGHFNFNATECYRLIVPTAGSPIPGVYEPELFTLQLFNDCSCCCPCGAYENVYKAMKRLHAGGRQTGVRIARTIDDFKNLTDKIKHEKEIREIPTMDLMLRPTPGYIMGVQVNLLNNPTVNDIFMDKPTTEQALIKMFVTSPDVSMTGAAIIPTSCWLFNNRYGNPWIHVIPKNLFTTTDLKDPGGIGLIIEEGIIPQKFYEIIKTTEFASLFFEIFWKDTVNPADGNKITVTLVSDLFKPYTLQKEDKLIKPFDGVL